MKTFWRHIRRSVTTALLTLFFVVASVQSCSAQLDQWGYWENGVSESWWFSSEDFTKDDAIEAVARWRSISVERQNAPGNEWSGDYFRGSDTHGTYMRWSPHAGFIIANVDKCQARIMGVSYGKVEISPALIQLFPEFSKTAASAHGHSHSEAHAPSIIRFIPVKWRGAQLLVSEEEMSDFGDYVAGLGKYNYWGVLYIGYNEFFTKLGGARSESSNEPDALPATQGENVDGEVPIAPPGYERLLKRPIEATVIAVGRRRVRHNYGYENPDGSEVFYEHASLTSVTVNAGATHGVKSGMIFHVAKPDEGDHVRILRVGKVSSTGVVIRSLNEDGSETFFDAESDQPKAQSKVAAGWKLTTSPF